MSEPEPITRQSLGRVEYDALLRQVRYSLDTGIGAHGTALTVQRHAPQLTDVQVKEIRDLVDGWNAGKLFRYLVGTEGVWEELVAVLNAELGGRPPGPLPEDLPLLEGGD